MRPSEQYSQMVQNGTIKFETIPFEALPCNWGKMVIAGYLARPGIAWQFGTQRIGDTYCIKVDHPEICYIDILPPGEFEIWGPGHKESLEPNAVSAMLLAHMFPGISVRNIKDDNTGESTTLMTLPNGRTAFVKKISAPPERP